MTQPGATSQQAVIGDLGDFHAASEPSSLATMQDRAGFNVAIPDTADANAKNVTASYVAPGSSVEMDFPPPDDQAKQLRPPYISVWESPWSGGNPDTAIQDDLKTAAEMGLTHESGCNVGSLPAVCVTATTPQQVDSTSQTYTYPNAAYVRFIDGDKEVHIAGGSSVEDLLKIANSLMSAGPDATQSSKASK